MAGKVKRAVGTLALGGTLNKLREVLTNYITSVFDWKRGACSAEACLRTIIIRQNQD